MKIQINKKPAVSYLFRFCILAAVLLLPLVFVNTPGASNKGLTIQISVTDSNPSVFLDEDQQNPYVISLPDKGKWFVVWEDWRNWNKTGSDIYGRFINADGTCGNEILITNSPGNQTVPHAAYRNGGPQSLSTDRLMIVWQDSRGDGNGGYIYYKTLDITNMDETCSMNISAAPETPVSYNPIFDDSLLSRYLPKISYDQSRDLFWIVWVENRDAIQRVAVRPFADIDYTSRDPGDFDPETHTEGYSTGDITYAAYIKINAGDMTVAPNTMGSPGPEVIRSDPETTMRHISRDVELKPGLQLGTTSATITETYEFFTSLNNITVASDAATAETLIAWEGIRHELKVVSTVDETKEEKRNNDGSVMIENNKIQYSYLYDPSSTFEISEAPSDGRVHIFSIFDKLINVSTIWTLQMDSSTTSDSYYPSVAADPAHRKFLVAWEDRNAFPNSKIFGQMLYTGGGLYKNNFIISTQDLDNDGSMDSDVQLSEQSRPHVSYDTANQRFFVTWQDGRNSTMSLENLDIYGQYVESEATSRGNNFAVTSAPGNQLNPVTSFNNANHTFLTVWKDSRNINETNSDIFGLPFTLDFGVPLDITPTSVDFPKMIATTSQSEIIELTNGTIANITIESLETGSELFKIDGILPGTSVPPGATVTAQVTFTPLNPGSYEDNLTIILGPETFILKIPLTGTVVSEEEGAEGGIAREIATETTTADSPHPLSISVATEETGRIYILRLHDPLDNNQLSALQPDGSWVDFPDQTDDGWQNLYYAVGRIQAETIDLDEEDLRGRPGVLHTASFVKDPREDPGPFDFTTGLIEHRSLTIRNSLGGTWVVSDTVVDSLGNPVVKVHPDPLVIQENGGTVTASWGDYKPTIQYISGIGYNVVFSVSWTVFTYTIQTVSDNSFTGTMQWAVGAEKSPVFAISGARSGF